MAMAGRAVVTRVTRSSRVMSWVVNQLMVVSLDEGDPAVDGETDDRGDLDTEGGCVGIYAFGHGGAGGVEHRTHRRVGSWRHRESAPYRRCGSR